MNQAFEARQPYPDSKATDSFEAGLEFQDFVVEQFGRWGLHIQTYASRRYQMERGESVQRAEIKLDRLCTRTGRLSIEVGERTALGRPWVPSGIYRGDNTVFYIQGNQEVIYLFDRRQLVRWYQRMGEQYEESPRERPTIRKFYLSLDDGDRLCIAKLTPGEAI